jgi:GMP synthase (glutamine-hydrolysing)
LVGESLGVPKDLLYRHPFPGPGLGIRILGDITEDKVRILQEVDFIFINTLKESGWYDKCWQALSVLLPVRSVGVMATNVPTKTVWLCAPLHLWMA